MTPRTQVVRRRPATGDGIRRLVVAAALIGLCTLDRSYAQAPATRPLSREERAAFDAELKSLQISLQELPADCRADAAIFAKGLQWALDYDEQFTTADIELLQTAAVRCRQRVADLASHRSWISRRGRLVLGFVSAVDGSIQPYGVVVPRNYDASRPIRLDVVLHGSQRPVGMSELRFIGRFNAGDAADTDAPDQPFIELHPLGRVENCYRWAGETDVFEAIEDVCRRFPIDRDRIVLRGMSMGASGTWHLGLKHPDRFVALGPYCGYVDTHRFSETPLPTFVKVGPLPEHQELGLHMLDSVDYAANAGIVPTVACMGEKDVFFDAHVLMGEAMQREGLELVNLISPGTGHVIDPATHAEQLRRIGEFAGHGLNRSPTAIRFVTWTLKYGRCHWLQLDGLEQHYHRAEFSAKLDRDQLVIAKADNITRFAIDLNGLPARPVSVQIDGASLAVPAELATGSVWLDRRDGQWRITGDESRLSAAGKRAQLQGPIDDAFTRPFVCVRGTGTPWNPGVQAYAEASLRRFASEWRQYFRGDLPIKNDSEVSDDDLRDKNLILFGDPGSNSWIARLQSDFPITWTRDVVQFGDNEYSAADHVPAWIMPNPLAGGRRIYVVFNSGHTFRGADLGKLNYLLFPRWGDWAVLKIIPRQTADTAASEDVIQAGYFDEAWQLPRAP